MRILLTANTSWYLHNFRSTLIQALRDAGHEVAIAAPEDEWSKTLEQFGRVYLLRFLRATGYNPYSDMRLFREYRRTLKTFGADIVLSFTAKSNIYAAFAARTTNTRVIPTINGLGRGLGAHGPVSTVVRRLYTRALRSCPHVFVQNDDDRAFLEANRILTRECVSVTPGSGVSLVEFTPNGNSHTRTDRSQVRFLYIGRLLVEKGVPELIHAVQLLRGEGEPVSLSIAGALQPGVPHPLQAKDLKLLEASGYITYHGMVSDVRPLIRESDAVVLASYYPEGVPHSLLQALAMGKPVITTDHPGCRETVIHEVNGYLVEPRNGDDLKQALKRFASLSEEERESMGVAGRQLAESRFDEQIVIRLYVQKLAELAMKAVETT